MSNLGELIKSIEPTDELISLNKRYIKLSETEAKLDEILSDYKTIYGYESKEYNIIQRQIDKIQKESVQLYKEVNEFVYKQKIAKWVFAVKTLRD